MQHPDGALPARNAHAGGRKILPAANGVTRPRIVSSAATFSRDIVTSVAAGENPAYESLPRSPPRCRLVLTASIPRRRTMAGSPRNSGKGMHAQDGTDRDVHHHHAFPKRLGVNGIVQSHRQRRQVRERQSTASDPDQGPRASGEKVPEEWQVMWSKKKVRDKKCHGDSIAPSPSTAQQIFSSRRESF